MSWIQDGLWHYYDRGNGLPAPCGHPAQPPRHDDHNRLPIGVSEYGPTVCQACRAQQNEFGQMITDRMRSGAMTFDEALAATHANVMRYQQLGDDIEALGDGRECERWRE
jgi:hypothetical protein